MTPEEVIKFWFEETTSSQWFRKDEKFDAEMQRRFLDTYEHVMRRETADWRVTPEGRLAEILVLDQFSRNMFRNSPEAFAGDALALQLAEGTIAAGDDKRLPRRMRRFVYMPFMHSESREMHKRAVRLFFWYGNMGILWYEFKHKSIIDGFGRYPHRNTVLGRESTPEEVAFMRMHKGF